MNPHEGSNETGADQADRDSPEKSPLAINSAGIGMVAIETVRARARELALLAGCASPHVRQSDYEQAKRELTGESDAGR